MTNQLENAFREASKLPEKEQNILARWLMEEIKSDKKWDRTFADSEDQLEKLAEEALEDYAQGNTTELNLKKL